MPGPTLLPQMLHISPVCDFVGVGERWSESLLISHSHSSVSPAFTLRMPVYAPGVVGEVRVLRQLSYSRRSPAQVIVLLEHLEPFAAGVADVRGLADAVRVRVAEQLDDAAVAVDRALVLEHVVRAGLDRVEVPAEAAEAGDAVASLSTCCVDVIDVHPPLAQDRLVRDVEVVHVCVLGARRAGCRGPRSRADWRGVSTCSIDQLPMPAPSPVTPPSHWPKPSATSVLSVVLMM